MAPNNHNDNKLNINIRSGAYPETSFSLPSNISTIRIEISYLEKDATVQQRSASHVKKNPSVQQRSTSYFEKDPTVLQRSTSHVERDPSEQQRSLYNYAIKQRRLESFDKKWNSQIKQTPEQLAESGFYYTGQSDAVRCHFCGVGLCMWEDTDDAWEEHVRWSPGCSYVRLMKGVQYISDTLVKINTPPEKSTDETDEDAEFKWASMGINLEDMNINSTQL